MKTASWKILSDELWELNEVMPSQITIPQIFTHPVYERIATLFLQHRKAIVDWQFLTTDQMVAIARRSKDAESDIDQVPGIYMFLSLWDEKVLKVGESKDMRNRIAFNHLRKATQNGYSLLKDYALSHWDVANESKWHELLHTHEVTTLLFRMHGSNRESRLLIERSLQLSLNPLMP